MDTTLYPVFLGLALAASTGLNTFLPLLMLAGAAHFKVIDTHAVLGGQFNWLTSTSALTALGLATLAEVVGDKIPVVDHALDTIGTVARPAVGAFAAASVWHGDPAMAAIAGLVLGAPVAFGFHAAKAGTRAASTATTLGIGNPILSTLEDFAALGLTAIGLKFPWLVPAALLVIGLILWRLYLKARKAFGKMSGALSRRTALS